MKEGFRKIWGYIEMPVYLMIIWTLLNLYFPMTDYLDTLTAGIIGWIVTIAFFGYIGYNISAKNEKTNFAAKSGAYAGAIVGFTKAVISLLAFFISPGIFDQAVAQAVSKGAPEETVRSMMNVMLYAALIISPLISAGIGALITWLSALIFKKKK